MSTPVLFLRGAIAQQNSKLRLNLGSTRNLKTMSALMSGHRIERDTFGKLFILIKSPHFLFAYLFAIFYVAIPYIPPSNLLAIFLLSITIPQYFWKDCDYKPF